MQISKWGIMYLVKKVSSFGEIDMSQIEYISFYYKNGLNSGISRNQITRKNIRHYYNDPFLYAFVNTRERGFFIVEKQKDDKTD
jgi:hypothetical protein